MNDRFHKLSEFGNLPWDKLEPAMCSRSWSFGWGGYGLSSGTMTISIYDANLDADVWEVPAALSAVVKMNADIQVRGLQASLRNLIGVDVASGQAEGK